MISKGKSLAFSSSNTFLIARLLTATTWCTAWWPFWPGALNTLNISLAFYFLFFNLPEAEPSAPPKSRAAVSIAITPGGPFWFTDWRLKQKWIPEVQTGNKNQKWLTVIGLHAAGPRSRTFKKVFLNCLDVQSIGSVSLAVNCAARYCFKSRCWLAVNNSSWSWFSFFECSLHLSFPYFQNFILLKNVQMDFTHVLSSMETGTPPPMKAGRKVLALTRQTSFIKWPNDGFKGPREAKDHKSR